jgi:hypothetical protein
MYFVIGNAQTAIAEPKTKCPCSLDRALLHIIQHRGDPYDFRECETDTHISGKNNTLRTLYSSGAEHILSTELITGSYLCHVLVEEGSDTQDFQQISITEDQYYACTEDISHIGHIADNPGILGDEEDWFGCNLTP